MRFDWYSATVKQPFENFRACVAAEFAWANPVEVRPFSRYDFAVEFTCGEERIARIDQHAATDSVLVTASSESSPRVARYLRDHWTHSVSRIDVCEDYTGPGVFEQLDALYVGVARDQGLRLDQSGDWVRNTGGRTRYVGARSSTTMVRVYEKGWQQYNDAKANGTSLPEDFDINRTRVEVQLRPHSKDKAKASSYSCADVVAYTPWTNSAHALLTGFELALPLKEARNRSPHERKMHHLAKQYGRTILAELERQGGSLELLGKVIVDQCYEIERNATRAAHVATVKG